MNHDYKGYTFSLFEAKSMAYSKTEFVKSANIFYIVGWDNNDSCHASSLLGFTYTESFIEISFLFMNFSFLTVKE